MILGSYNTPILEEEYDPTYYDSMTHIPGSGDYGTYTDYDGTEVTIQPMGMIPYFMWNVTGGMYANVYYGANFVDYVGYVEDKLTLIRPVNGEHYDSFIMDKYFDLTIDGPQAPDDTALAAIFAIKAIPERVSWNDRDLVEAARMAYNKVATTAQQALVTNYADLISAEQRITLLDPANQENAGEEGVEGTESDVPADTEPSEKEPSGMNWAAAIIILVLAIGAAVAVAYKEQIMKFLNSKKDGKGGSNEK